MTAGSCFIPNAHVGACARQSWRRDEHDLQKHVDYIHYNPVKHGLVTRLEDWPWSSYHQYLKEGLYGLLINPDETINSDAADFGE